MPTTGIVNGHNLRLKVEGANVARATTCKIEFKNKTRTTAHKDTTGGWETVDYGEYSGTLSSDFLFEETAGNFEDLYAFFAAGTKVTCVFATSTAGDTSWTVEGVIESMNIDAPNNENSTASISIIMDGAPTKGTIS